MSTSTKLEHHLVHERCENAEQLKAWIDCYTGLNIPTEPVCAHHRAPFDYIHHTYFEPAKDLIVWAPRGGGKTRLAALATLLDLLHKPGCAVRILGGSLEQSLRMWEHLFPDLARIAEDLLDTKAKTSRRLSLSNGSSVAVLTQSQRAVRGLRVQKLRCDEVEMFKPEVWEAAQLVTKSRGKDRVSGIGCRVSGEENADLNSDSYSESALHPTPEPRYPTPDLFISGAIEAISTFHQPWGLMSRIIDAASARGIEVYRWCILDVLERCSPERECATCPLWEECQGVAKTRCNGYVSIDDACAMKQRVSKQTWECEMLCLRPSVSGSVFPSFQPEIHVREEVETSGQHELSLAIDFGFAAPFVCLWIRTFANGVTHVIDEYIQPGVQLEGHIEQIQSRRHGTVARLACDPAGAGRNDQTAASNVALLRHHGFLVRHRKSLIVEGLEMIRAALSPATGAPKLFVHPRCKRLIKALQAYHYPPGGGEQPVKDGIYDHPIDALRYHFVNRPGAEKEPPRRY